MHIVKIALCIVQCSVYSTLYSVQCTVPCAVFSVHYIVKCLMFAALQSPFPHPLPVTWQNAQSAAGFFHCQSGVLSALHCTVMNTTALHITLMHCTALHCTAPHCPALHCTALHYSKLDCTELQSTECSYGAAMGLQILPIGGSGSRFGGDYDNT